MAKKEKEWKCEPCGTVNGGEDSSEVCMICGLPSSKTKMKIVTKKGKRSITYIKDKKKEPS